jgi:uncharacterized membrane protein
MTGPRIPAVDLARTAALGAMASFHLTFDLELFGLIARGTTTSGFFWYYARAIAGSFLFLAGLSLWLGHGGGIRWRAFLRRLAIVAGAAALVTAATRIAMPQAYVFFGILHAIAVSSVIGLAFLRLPAALTLSAAAVALWLPGVARGGIFDHPWLVWTGLSSIVLVSVDFEPVFPWVAPFLAGIAAGRIGARAGLWDRLAGWPADSRRLWRVLAWPGRNSLLVYLVHQPVLIALVRAWAALWG